MGGSGLSGRLRPLSPARAHFPSCPLTFVSPTFSPAHLEATLAPSLPNGHNSGWFWRPRSGDSFKTSHPRSESARRPSATEH